MLSELILATKIAATDLNSRLQSAVCSQDWTGAIAIVDQMRAIAPQAESSLVIYGSRLLSLRGAPMPPGSIAGCGTTAAQVNPTVANTAVVNLTGTRSIFIDLTSITRGTADVDNRIANFQLIDAGREMGEGRIAANCRSGYVLLRLSNGILFESQINAPTETSIAIINRICSRNSPPR